MARLKSEMEPAKSETARRHWARFLHVAKRRAKKRMSLDCKRTKLKSEVEPANSETARRHRAQFLHGVIPGAYTRKGRQTDVTRLRLKSEMARQHWAWWFMHVAAKRQSK